MHSALRWYELDWAREANTTWYRSKETVPIKLPFVGGGYLSNKKWPLTEGYTIIYNIHMITFVHLGTLKSF